MLEGGPLEKCSVLYHTIVIIITTTIITITTTTTTAKCFAIECWECPLLCMQTKMIKYNRRKLQLWTLVESKVFEELNVLPFISSSYHLFLSSSWYWIRRGRDSSLKNGKKGEKIKDSQYNVAKKREKRDSIETMFLNFKKWWWWWWWW